MTRIGRRHLLQKSVTVLTALSSPAAAQTPAKLTRADAGYQDKPRDGLTCEACTFFRKPRSCQVVDGDVSPDGWCRLFDMPD